MDFWETKLSWAKLAARLANGKRKVAEVNQLGPLGLETGNLQVDDNRKKMIENHLPAPSKRCVLEAQLAIKKTQAKG